MNGFAATCAEEIRATVSELKRLAPSDRNPDHFTATKGEIAHRLSQIADMLEGNFTIHGPDPKPIKSANDAKRRPTVTHDRNGRVIHVDFKNRRRVQTPPTPPRK